MGIASHVEWRVKRIKESLLAARAIDSKRLLFLLRESLPAWSEGTYEVQGRAMSITHHREDIAIFRELFVAGFYDFPDDWLGFAPRKIVDVGGNIGMFALLANIRYPDAEVIAFEPDPVNAAKYRVMLASNAIVGNLIEACASNAAGTARFVSGQESTSHLSDEGDLMPAVDLFEYLDDADLLKMDIEGGEWAILLDERFLEVRVPLVLMEYHPYLSPEPDAQRLAESILTRAGYEVERIEHDETNGVGLLRGRQAPGRVRK